MENLEWANETVGAMKVMSDVFAETTALEWDQITLCWQCFWSVVLWYWIDVYHITSEGTEHLLRHHHHHLVRYDSTWRYDMLRPHDMTSNTITITISLIRWDWSDSDVLTSAAEAYFVLNDITWLFRYGLPCIFIHSFIHSLQSYRVSESLTVACGLSDHSDHSHVVCCLRWSMCVDVLLYLVH